MPEFSTSEKAEVFTELLGKDALQGGKQSEEQMMLMHVSFNMGTHSEKCVVRCSTVV